MLLLFEFREEFIDVSLCFSLDAGMRVYRCDREEFLGTGCADKRFGFAMLQCEVLAEGEFLNEFRGTELAGVLRTLFVEYPHVSREMMPTCERHVTPNSDASMRLRVITVHHHVSL